MRRLAFAAGGFSAAIFMANYILPARLLPWLALLCAAAALGLGFMRRKWLRAFVITLAALAVGFVWFGGTYLAKALPAKALDGETAELEGVVLTYSAEYDGYCRYEMRLRLPDGGVTRAVVYDRSGAAIYAEPGWRLRISAYCRAADTRYGEDYDYYNSNGIFLVASVKTPPKVISAQRSAWLSFGQDISRSVCAEIERIFPRDAAAFMKSLLIGSREELYEDAGAYMAMGRAGITHIVAISGMHVAFLISILQLALGKSRRSSVLCIIAVWVFVAATGASQSAVRAGVMQSMLLIAPIFGRENDPPTSLMTALAILLAANPYSAASVSLQLSFGAVAGLMLFSEKLSALLMPDVPRGTLRRIIRWPVNVAASSLSVMALTVPLAAWHFGYIAILSPIANVMCLWAVSACFCGGYIACLAGIVFAPAGAALAWLTSLLARYVLWVARLIGGIPFAALYTDDVMNVIWIVLAYALLIIAAVSKLPRWAKISLPGGLAVLSLALLLCVNAQSMRVGAGVITVLDVGQGQCISVISGDKTVLIDCGGIYSLDNAGETAGSYLLSRGRKRVDVLLLTHLHADHVNGMPRLLELVDVGEIIIPDAVTDEDGMLDEIVSAAESHGTALRRLDSDELFSVGNIELNLFAPSEKGDLNERCMMMRVSIGAFDMIVTGDAPQAAERELIESHELPDAELLIAGHHGSKYSSSGELLSAAGAETAVISVGYNSYGHPTNETLERLRAYGYNVYRTDLNGNVEIRLPAE